MGIEIDDDERFTVAFEGYEGPIDALLELARAQRVDLAAIDIVAIVAQFERILSRALELRIEVAADWLVAASWLAYLKSRSLLKRPKAEGNAEPDEDSLAFHLRRLDALRRGAEALADRRQVGRDWFAPGTPDVPEGPAGRVPVSLHGLLEAYLRVGADEAELESAPDLKPFDLCSVDSAIAVLRRDLGGLGWRDILTLLPPGAVGLRARSNVASHVVAALELTRVGAAEIMQETLASPVMVRERIHAG